MEKTQKTLMTTWWVGILAALLLSAAFEAEVLVPGGLEGRHGLEFMVLAGFELLTIATIPLALRLFRFGAVRAALEVRPAEALKKWGLLRLVMLESLLVANTLLYYLFVKAAFGYLAIILLLCLLLVVPTRKRCEGEAGRQE